MLTYSVMRWSRFNHHKSCNYYKGYVFYCVSLVGAVEIAPTTFALKVLN
jgi:hypothetical protein